MLEDPPIMLNRELERLWAWPKDARLPSLLTLTGFLRSGDVAEKEGGRERSRAGGGHSTLGNFCSQSESKSGRGERRLSGR